MNLSNDIFALFQIIFSVIVLANAKPSSDYSEPPTLDDSNVSASDDSEESPNENANHPIGIYTKYPDDPNDSYKLPESAEIPLDDDDTRVKRSVTQNQTDSAVDTSEHAADSSNDTKTVEPTKVPLSGLISSIESDLVFQAQQVNAHLRALRTIPDTVDEDSSKENSTSTDDSVDVNKNFFEGLFNFTRPLRETEDKDIKIPLGGLINAVESSLVNSAQNFKEPVQSKRDVAVENDSNSNETHRINRDCATDDQESIKQPNIQVQALSASNAVQNLNLLSPITFKPTSEAASVDDVTLADEDGISTTETTSIHKTDLTVVDGSKGTSLIPGSDNKLAHVQHQEISKTIFSSNLAIFPTIRPKSINAPLPQFTTTEQPDIETTVAVQSTTAAKKTELQLKHEQLLQKAQELKEKFAEIQADPVILSQF